MSLIVILNFAVDDDDNDDDYIFFSVQKCTVMENHCFIVGFSLLWLFFMFYMLY